MAERQRETVKIHSLYKPLYTSKKRYLLVTGGRGSLKSTTIHDFAARLTYQKGQGVMITRYTMTSAEKSIIPEFKKTLERNGAIDDFTITRDKAVNIHTGSFVIFTGVKTSSGNQTANLKSLAGITTWIIEEGEDFVDEGLFHKVDDSIRDSEVPNRVIWIQNPSTKDHFIYKLWIKDTNKKIKVQGYDVTVSDHPDVEHIHSTYHIAKELGYLDESWLKKAEQAKKDNPKWYYHNYIGGWKEKAEGAIFPTWKEGKFDESLPYAYGMDLGHSPDPTVLCKVAVDKNNKICYVKQSLFSKNLSFENIKDHLLRICGKQDLIISDNNEKRLIVDLRRQYGLNIEPTKKYAGSVYDRIMKLQDYQIIVDPESIDVKTALNNYAWNDKKAGIPQHTYSHAPDAIMYAFMRLILERKTVIV